MKKEADRWIETDSKEIADCRVFTVHERMMRNAATQKDSSFFVIDCPDWVNIVAITAEGKVVLIEQFRYGLDEMTLEIPGGMIDADETPLETAGRELLEETGYTAGTLIPLGFSVPNPAIQTNRMHHFLAAGCVYTGGENFDEHESIVTRLVEIGEIRGLVENGEISHSLVLAALLRYEYYQTDQSKKQI